MMNETRFIPGTGHAYSCDKEGNIYSHYIQGSHKISEAPQRKLIPYKGKTNDYLMVGLSLEKQCKNYLVHRLVAKTWIDNPDNLPEVDHLDNNVENNRVDNLQWITREENLDRQEIDKGSLNGLRSYCRLYRDGGLFIAAFPSITAACSYASENFGCSKSGMSKYHKSKGYYIEAENEDKRKFIARRIKSNWELFTPEGKSLGIFPTKTAAGRYVKENIRDISIKLFSNKGKAYGYYVVEKSVETK